MYSLLRKSVLSLRDLFPMKTALLSVQAPLQSPPSRIAEKLDLELDFVEAALPSKTRSTHPHLLFSPIHYEPNYAYPLLIWLHGSGGDERQLMQIMPIVSMRNYVAVAPRGLPIEPPVCPPTLDLSVSAILQRPKEQYDWMLADHLTAIEQRIFDCIAVAQERCNIADHRMFIAGFGTGGTAALRLAMLYPECFAGAAAFGGDLPNGNRIVPSWHPTQTLSVLLGVEETVSDPVCQMMELLHIAGFPANVREYPDIKSLTPAMLQDLNRWMMEIVCPAEGKVPAKHNSPKR